MLLDSVLLDTAPAIPYYIQYTVEDTVPSRVLKGGACLRRILPSAPTDVGDVPCVVVGLGSMGGSVSPPCPEVIGGSLRKGVKTYQTYRSTTTMACHLSEMVYRM